MTTDALFRNSHITAEMRQRLLDAGTIRAAYEHEGSIARAARSIGVGTKSFRKAMALWDIPVHSHPAAKPHAHFLKKKRNGGKETPLDVYIDTVVFNGKWRPSFEAKLGMPEAGCPYRGTTVCHECPFEPAALCDYRCKSAGGHSVCEHRAVCKCGWDQTERLKAWGLVE